MITTPISVMFHLANPNLTSGEKAIMVGYELAVATGGIAIACLVNPVGALVIVPLLYPGITYIIGSGLQYGLETNDWR